MDRATARRCLLTLHDQGYADYDGKFFTLTARVLRLGMGALAAMPLAQMVQPWLDQLSERIGQSTSVSILDRTEIVYLARAAQRRVMSIGLMPGSRLPAHCTSMGRVLLAALPPDEARAIIEASDLTPRTPHSLTDPSILSPELGASGAHALTVFGLHQPHRWLSAANNDATRARLQKAVLDSLNSVLAEPVEPLLLRDADDRPCIETRTTLDLETELGRTRLAFQHQLRSFRASDRLCLCLRPRLGRVASMARSSPCPPRRRVR